MIDANSKTNSFLEAIEKYAEEQKQAMRAEVEAFREEQLSRATKRVRRRLSPIFKRKRRSTERLWQKKIP